MKVLLVLINLLVVLNAQDNYFEQNRTDCNRSTTEDFISIFLEELYTLIDPTLEKSHKTTRFILFTNSQQTKGEILVSGNYQKLTKSGFNANWPVRFIIHGYVATSDDCLYVDVKNSYLRNGNFNVILVDWRDYAMNIDYVRSLGALETVAQRINNLTSFLHKATNVQYNDIYLIGHSLGAHIAGSAGKLSKPNLYGVIFGLDPAGPVFRVEEEFHRLSPSDALYVETIHTDSRILGIDSADLGHAAFFVDWGLGQRHCPNFNIFESVLTCDHTSAVYYFAESLRNRNSFGAMKCKSFESMRSSKCGCGKTRCKAEAFMGGEPAIPKHGVYYLSTRKRPPFGYGNISILKKPLLPTPVRLQKNNNNKIK